MIKPRLLFSFYLCLRLTSPNFAFMRCRLYSKRKSSNTWLDEKFSTGRMRIFTEESSCDHTENDASYAWDKNLLKIHDAGLRFRVWNENLIFLFLNQNICLGCSKEPSQWGGSSEHPKHMLKLMGNKTFTILRRFFCLSKPMMMIFLWQCVQV